MSELVRAYEKYRSKRAQIKERQKADLERELEDYAVEVGRAVLNERSEGKTVDDILVILGNKNRNFVYDVIASARRFNDPTLPDEEEQKPAMPLGSLVYYMTAVSADNEYSVTLFRYTENGEEHEASVKLHTDKYGKVIDMPESWWMDVSKEDRKVYKEIIQTIEE